MPLKIPNSHRKKLKISPSRKWAFSSPDSQKPRWTARMSGTGSADCHTLPLIKHANQHFPYPITSINGEIFSGEACHPYSFWLLQSSGLYELNKWFLHYCLINFTAEVNVSTPCTSVGTDSKASEKRTMQMIKYHLLSLLQHELWKCFQQLSHLLRSYLLFSPYVKSRDTF